MSNRSPLGDRRLYALPALSLLASGLGLALLLPGPFPPGLATALLTLPFALHLLLRGGKSLPFYMLAVLVLAFLTPSVPYTYPPVWAQELTPVVLWLSLGLLLTLRLLARSENEAGHRASTTSPEERYVPTVTATTGLRPSRGLGRSPELTQDPAYRVLSRYFGEAFTTEYDRAALRRYLRDLSARSPSFKPGLPTRTPREERPHPEGVSILRELGLGAGVALSAVTSPLWLLSFELPWVPVPPFEVTQPEIVALLLASLAGLLIVVKRLISWRGSEKPP